MYTVPLIDPLRQIKGHPALLKDAGQFRSALRPRGQEARLHRALQSACLVVDQLVVAA